MNRQIGQGFVKKVEVVAVDDVRVTVEFTSEWAIDELLFLVRLEEVDLFPLGRRVSLRVSSDE